MNTRSRSRQRGAAALVVAMVLLFGMTIVAFFANRTMIFEQRTSANQYRYTKAFELADAGVEWAIARLNDAQTLPAYAAPTSTSADTAYINCNPAATPASTLKSFRDRYIRPTMADVGHPTGWLDPLSSVFPGCQVDPVSGNKTCDCPPAGPAVLLVPTNQSSFNYAAGTANLPRFRVKFNAVASPSTDWLAVEIVSRGCTGGDPCDPSLPVSTATDATATARMLVKIRPTFPTGPGAGLISGSTTVVSGSLNVINTDTAGNGITINSGSTVDLSGPSVSVVTLPGTPPAASILDNDPALLKLTNADASGELFFTSFLGEGFADFQTNLGTVVINAGPSSAAGRTCSSAVDCGSAVSYWADRGFTQFWVVPDVTFNNSNMPSTNAARTLGTAAKPIVVATPSQFTTTGGITAYGVFYAATASAVDDLTLSGGGNSTIIGSLISRGDFARTGNGNISIVYNANLFGGKGPPTGLLVPVPGSWRDKSAPY